MQKLLYISAEDFGFGPISVLTQALTSFSLPKGYQFVIESGTNHEPFLRKNNLAFQVKENPTTILDLHNCRGSIICQNPITALLSWKHGVPCLYLDNFFWFWECNIPRIRLLYQKIKQFQHYSDEKFTAYLDNISRQHPHDLYLVVHFFTHESLIQYFGETIPQRLKELENIGQITHHFYGATIAPQHKQKKSQPNKKPYIYVQLGGMLSPQTTETYLSQYLTIVCGALNQLNHNEQYQIECKIPKHLLACIQPRFPHIQFLTTISFDEHINKIRQADYLFIQPGINSIFEAVYFRKRLFILPELNPSHSENMHHLLKQGFSCHHFCFYSVRPKKHNLTSTRYLTTAIKKLPNQKFLDILTREFIKLLHDKDETKKAIERKKIITQLVKNFRGSQTASSYITAFIQRQDAQPHRLQSSSSLFTKASKHLTKDWLTYLMFASLNLIIRLPSFLEPVWYVDEALYILIGKQLAAGSVLYRDIVDHKPPLVYFLAYLIPNQAGLRLLMYISSTFGAIFFHQLIALLVPNLKKLQQTFYTLIFIVLMGIPAFEGYIFNAEPIYLPFSLAALVLFLKIKQPAATADPQQVLPAQTNRNALIYGVGLLLGLAIFTKITALLYAIPISLLLGGHFILQVISKEPIKKYLYIILESFFLLLGILTPFLIGLLYFSYHHSVSDYLFWTFSYNFSDYLNHWEYFYSFPHQVFIFLFSTTAKTAVLGAALLVLTCTWLFKRVTTNFFFTSCLALATLYGVTLSNRPFPNYWLQFIPPAIILSALLIHTKQKLFATIVTVGTFLAAGFIFKLIPFKPFPVTPYYLVSWRYAVGSITRQEYEQYFNPLVDESLNPNSPDVMGDNRRVILALQEQNINTLYVWGTNPMIFVDAPLVLTTKFPLTFHLAELGTLSEQVNLIKQQQLPAIVVMKPYPYREETAFYTYLDQNYSATYNGSAMTLFIRK